MHVCLWSLPRSTRDALLNLRTFYTYEGTELVPFKIWPQFSKRLLIRHQKHGKHQRRPGKRIKGDAAWPTDPFALHLKVPTRWHSISTLSLFFMRDVAPNSKYLSLEICDENHGKKADRSPHGSPPVCLLSITPKLGEGEAAALLSGLRRQKSPVNLNTNQTRWPPRLLAHAAPQG